MNSKLKKEKKVKEFSFFKWLEHKLRRASYSWPARHKAKAKARIARGVYKCASCGGEFGQKEINVDHIEPVISQHDGFIDWNTYIERLFVDEDKLQILCKATCHKAKSFRENSVRRQVKKEKKDVAKK